MFDCTDLFPNILYRKCIIYDHKQRRKNRGGRGGMYGYSPRPLKSTWRHGHFLKSTCDVALCDMRNKIRDTAWGIS